MIKIYFDDVLLDSDNYISFDANYKMFDNTFFLGSTSNVEASLKIPSDALPDSLNEVSVMEDDDLLFSFIVDNITINDDAEAEIKLVDKMILTQQPYDFSDNVPITAKDLLEDICTNFGIEYNYEAFVNEDISIASYDNTLTGRDYISYIAEAAGCYARMVGNELKLIKYNSGTYTITSDDIDTSKLGEKIKIERVVYEFGTTKYETSSDDTLYTVYLDSNNMFLQVMTEEQFNDLADQILNFEFYNIKIDTCNLFTFNDTCVIFNIYNILNQWDVSYGGGYVGSYETQINNQQQELTQLTGTAEKINRIKQNVDQANGKISVISTQIEQLDPERIEEIKQILSDLDLGGYALKTDLNNIITKVNEVIREQTNTYTKTEIREILKGQFIDESGEVVPEIVKTLSATIDLNGLKIEKTDSPTSSLLDEKGIYIKDSNNEEILKAGYETYIDSGGNEQSRTIVRARDMEIKKYLIIEPCRFEKYTVNGEDTLGCFWVGE